MAKKNAKKTKGDNKFVSAEELDIVEEKIFHVGEKEFKSKEEASDYLNTLKKKERDAILKMIEFGDPADYLTKFLMAINSGEIVTEIEDNGDDDVVVKVGLTDDDDGLLVFDLSFENDDTDEYNDRTPYSKKKIYDKSISLADIDGTEIVSSYDEDKVMDFIVNQTRAFLDILFRWDGTVEGVECISKKDIEKARQDLFPIPEALSKKMLAKKVLD